MVDYTNIYLGAFWFLDGRLIDYRILTPVDTWSGERGSKFRKISFSHLNICYSPVSLFQNGLICPLIPAACQVREHSIPLLLVLILPVFPRPLHHVPRRKITCSKYQRRLMRRWIFYISWKVYHHCNSPAESFQPQPSACATSFAEPEYSSPRAMQCNPIFLLNVADCSLTPWAIHQ